ncbi:MAG: hypothetical protein HRT47_02705 [Candidatus Caenarcaniphilales bacterium]|nr:hypothetical protein [Candidatus Caenarcaniphilales bacterium]
MIFSSLTLFTLCCLFLLISSYDSPKLELISKKKETLINSLGEKIFYSLNLKSLNKVQAIYRDLYIDPKKLYSAISLILVYSSILLLMQFIKINYLTLLCTIGIIFELIKINLNIVKRKNYLESQLSHFLYCLETLCLKNQIGLIQALKEIETNSDEKFLSFIQQILNEAENANTNNIDEFIPFSIKHSDEIKSLLRRILSYSDFENLELYFNEIKEKISLELKLKREDLIENIQLYISIPVISMMFLASYPLYSSILFSIKGIIN